MYLEETTCSVCDGKLLAVEIEVPQVSIDQLTHIGTPFPAFPPDKLMEVTIEEALRTFNSADEFQDWAIANKFSRR